MSISELTSPEGTFRLLALDHREALRNAFRRAGVADITPAQIRETKGRIARVLGAEATGILLDYDAVGCRPPGIGLLTPLEAQGHEPLDGGRLNRLEFDAAAARSAGADGCKLLLWYRADHAASAARQRELLARAADDCRREGLPLILEPLVYTVDGETDDDFAAAFGDLVVAAAEELHDCDVLKLQFAGDDACERVTRAASPLPWALLGGSEVDGETFARQLRTACAAGCSGFMAGRAIWSGVLGLAPAEQEPWLEREALPLFRRLVAATT
jgi:tagatose-1,6-bisphosphate aldolase